MSDLNTIDKELIEEKFKNVNLKIDSNQEKILIYLEKILDQAERTNGRVNKLEEETRLVRTLTKYPKLVWFSMLGGLFILIREDLFTLIRSFM